MAGPAGMSATRIPAWVECGSGEVPGLVHRLGPERALLWAAPEDNVGLEAGQTSRLVLDSEAGIVPLAARIERVRPEAVDHRGRQRTEVALAWAELEDHDYNRLREVLALQRPTVLLIGFPEDLWRSYARELIDMRVLRANGPAEALAQLDQRAFAVVCVGPDIGVDATLDLLETVTDRFPHHGARLMVAAGGDDLSRFLPFIEADKLFYLTARPLPAEGFRRIALAALSRRPAAEDTARKRGALLNRAVRDAHQVALHSDLVSLSLAMREAVVDLLHASRCYCLFYDPLSQSLVSLGPDGSEERRETAAVGLASFIVRTGRSLVSENVGREAHYDPEADTPDGSGDERFLGVPIPGPRGESTAALVALRPAAQKPFTTADREALEAFAAQLGPLIGVKLDRWLRQSRGQLVETEAPEFGSHLFRQAAVESFRQGERGEGGVLRISPLWMTLSYRLLLTVLVAGLLFSFFAHVRQYADGPAVVMLSDADYLTATNAGTIADVAVESGEEVEAGQVLLSFYEFEEAAELSRIEEELEAQLRRRLRDPSDSATEQALISLRAQRDLARSRLGQRSVRAPAAGTVGDLRVREGQLIIPGQVLVALASETREPRVVALVPGRYRPELEAGKELHFQVSGYPYSNQILEIEAVGQEIVGPQEAQRILGTTVGDAIEVRGPVVPVYARLPSDHFEASGKRLPYHSGMWGQARIPLRSERILSTLMPFLKSVFGGGGD